MNLDEILNFLYYIFVDLFTGLIVQWDFPNSQFMFTMSLVK